MSRNVRSRLRRSCSGCSFLFQTQRSYDAHLRHNSFCRRVHQCDETTNEPSTDQNITPRDKKDSAGLTQAHTLFQSATAVVDDWSVPQHEERLEEFEFEPDVHCDDLPEPPECVFESEELLSNRSQTSKVFSKETASFVKLLDKLTTAGSPLCLFDEMIKWAVDAAMNGVTFHANMPSRAKVMIDLEKRHQTMAMKPKSLPYELEGDVTKSLPVFNFKATLSSLLHDERLMQPGNVVVKPDDPVHFQERHSLETLDVDELHTGTVCRNSIKETCIGPQDVFVGIILCIDGTVLGNFTNAKLKPVMFSLSVFNRETRNQSYAWRPSGCIKRPVDNLINEEQGLGSLKGCNNRNCHSALRLILKDLIAVQKDGGHKCDLIIGNNINRGMQLKLKLVCVIGDCEGADSLCSRHASHSLGVKSSCRDCKCLTVDADRTDLECEWRQRIDFFNAADAELKQMSHHKVANVFDDIDMCDNAGGISLCTPPEILHWKNLGLDKLAVLHFNEQVLGNGQNAKTFDALLGMVSQFCQHQSDRNMPLVTFNKGFASLTKKSIKAPPHPAVFCAL